MDSVQMPTNTTAPNQVVQTIASPLVKPLDDLNDKPLPNTNGKSMNKLFLFLIPLIVILAGGATGYLLSGNRLANKNTSGNTGMGVVETKDNSVVEEGIKDEKLFPDKAEGELQVNDGSLTKEGTHILIRPGGADQTAYLTSSIVDLEKFVGKKVEIYGQSNTAQKAGWLLDVGFVHVIE